ncbi:molybdopterin-dependent oxidoreductase [Chloroflexota bacterium]
MEKTGEGKVKVTRTVCPIVCGCACGILAHVKDGMLVKVEPADFPDPKHRHICSRGLCTPKLVHHPDRLKYPMKRAGARGEGKWKRISWDEALDEIGSAFKDILEKYGPGSVAFISGGPTAPGATASQRFASATQASWVRAIGFGDAAGPCADILSYGTVFNGEQYTTDYDNPRLCVVWGSNMAETRWWEMRSLLNAKEKGAKIVVIDPRFTPTAAKADEYIPIRPGTDAALILAMINVIIGEGLCDEPFVIEHTVGPLLVRSDDGRFLRANDISSDDSTTSYIVWDTETDSAKTSETAGTRPALRGTYTVDGIVCKPAFQLLADLAEEYSFDKASDITQVSPEVIRRLAVEYATNKPVASRRGMGLQRTFHGDLTFRAITTLAAITGNICLKSAQDFVLNWRPFIRPEGTRSYKRLPIMQMYENVITGEPYPIKALWVSTQNLVNQLANANKMVNEVLSRLELIVAVDIFMTATAEQADIVLPGCTPFECTSICPPFGMVAHPYLQLQPKVIEPLYECRSDLDILSGLAQKMGFGELFQSSEDEIIKMLLASEHPSMEGITLERLREGPCPLTPYSFPTFATPSGRLEFYSENEELRKLGEALPVYKEPIESNRNPLARKYPLSFFQTHTKYRHHSNFTNVSWLTELEPEPVLEINPVDAEKRGIEDGDMASVFNDRGRVKVKALVHEGIKPGLVNITQGWWPKHFSEGSHQDLTHDAINPAQATIYDSNAALYDVLVEVEKT